jgi:hypothetical protein
MDATRARRTRDHVRQAWYAGQRQRRFARRFWFTGDATGQADSPGAVTVVSSGQVGPRFRPRALAH